MSSVGRREFLTRLFNFRPSLAYNVFDVCVFGVCCPLLRYFKYIISFAAAVSSHALVMVGPPSVGFPIININGVMEGLWAGRVSHGGGGAVLGVFVGLM